MVTRDFSGKNSPLGRANTPSRRSPRSFPARGKVHFSARGRRWVPGGAPRVMICRGPSTLLAFESPDAAARAWHNHARTFELMARSRRRNPASGATAAAAAAAPPGDPSPPNDGAPPDEPAPVQCLCGDEHTGTYAPHWSGMEYTRLVEVFCDESMRDAAGRLGSGRTREAIDANVEDPFVAMARLYNSASFKPDNVVPAVECAAIQPGNVRFHHTRTPNKLKEKYKELKKNISVVQGNYEKSGQNDPDKTQADFTDDKPLLYCWLRLDAAGFLEDFGTRRLPGVCRGLGGGSFAPLPHFSPIFPLSRESLKFRHFRLILP